MSKKKDKKRINAALKVAVSAIYFNDSSDYETALYVIIKELTGSENFSTSDGINKLFNELHYEQL